MYDIKDSEIGMSVLDDLSKLASQLRVIHSFILQEPFQTWFIDDEQYDVREHIYFSVFPAAISSACRLLDPKKKVRSLRLLLSEYQTSTKFDKSVFQNEIDCLRQSDEFLRLEMHRHQLVAHRSHESTAQKRLENLGKSTSLTAKEAAETLFKTAQLAKRIWEAGSQAKSLPVGFSYLDVRAIKMVLRIYGKETTNPSVRFNNLVGQNIHNDIFSLNFDDC